MSERVRDTSASLWEVRRRPTEEGAAVIGRIVARAAELTEGRLELDRMARRGVRILGHKELRPVSGRAASRRFRGLSEGSKTDVMRLAVPSLFLPAEDATVHGFQLAPTNKPGQHHLLLHAQITGPDRKEENPFLTERAAVLRTIDAIDGCVRPWLGMTPRITVAQLYPVEAEPDATAALRQSLVQGLYKEFAGHTLGLEVAFPSATAPLDPQAV